MYYEITLKQARADLKYMEDKYGSENDFCGSFCNTDMLKDILHGKSTIKETIIENIRYFFSNGIDEGRGFVSCMSDIKPDLSDKRTQKIVLRYSIQGLLSAGERGSL